MQVANHRVALPALSLQDVPGWHTNLRTAIVWLIKQYSSNFFCNANMLKSGVCARLSSKATTTSPDFELRSCLLTDLCFCLKAFQHVITQHPFLLLLLHTLISSGECDNHQFFVRAALRLAKWFWICQCAWKLIFELDWEGNDIGSNVLQMWHFRP